MMDSIMNDCSFAEVWRKTFELDDAEASLWPETEGARAVEEDQDDRRSEAGSCDAAKSERRDEDGLDGPSSVVGVVMAMLQRG